MRRDRPSVSARAVIRGGTGGWFQTTTKLVQGPEGLRQPCVRVDQRDDVLPRIRRTEGQDEWLRQPPSPEHASRRGLFMGPPEDGPGGLVGDHHALGWHPSRSTIRLFAAVDTVTMRAARAARACNPSLVMLHCGPRAERRLPRASGWLTVEPDGIVNGQHKRARYAQGGGETRLVEDVQIVARRARATPTCSRRAVPNSGREAGTTW